MLQADDRKDADLDTSSQPCEDSETEESGSVFQTCLEVNTTDNPSEDLVASSECQTRINNVTFKNSVEEFSASSLVSATTERSKEAEQGEGLEDLYCDDELNNSMLMDS